MLKEIESYPLEEAVNYAEQAREEEEEDERVN